MLSGTNHCKRFRLLGFLWFWVVDLSRGCKWRFPGVQLFCSVFKPSLIGRLGLSKLSDLAYVEWLGLMSVPA